MGERRRWSCAHVFRLHAGGQGEGGGQGGRAGHPVETDDYEALPDWKPGCGYEVVDSDFDIIPVYHTDAINTDSWLMENPYVNEINEENPYGYTIEMNAAKAKEKGLANGGQGAPLQP